MTYTQQITMNAAERLNPRGSSVMDGWIEINQVAIRDRIREREIEAAGERLAATVRTTTANGLRRSVGRLLINAGRRVAGEPVTTGSSGTRPAHPMAA